MSGTAQITPVLEKFVNNPTLLYWVAGTFIVGFGVKAGLAPLHVWLPQAHPVAPSPASALLSGIMIKTGAYGIIRFMTVSLTSGAGAEAVASLTVIPQTIGVILVVVAIITMLAGAVMALMQTSMKKILAYSSVSQMGYIILPLGLAVYLGKGLGGLAYVGSIFHLFNHAIFKSGLFMMFGAVYLLTHTLDFDKLGGMRKVLPFTAVVALIGSLAVLGMPGFSGFSSKTIIHDALLVGAKETQIVWIDIAEKMFVLGSALTAAYFIKLYSRVFLGEYKGKHQVSGREHTLVRVVTGIYAAVILTVGVLPYWFTKFVGRVSAEGIPWLEYHLLEHLDHIHFWDSHAYWGVVMPALLGVGIFFLTERLHFENWKPPVWLSVEYLFYRPISQGFLYICSRYVCGIEGGIADVYETSSTVSGSLIRRVRRIDSMIDDGYDQGSQVSTQLIRRVRQIDDMIDDGYDQGSQVSGGLINRVRKIDDLISEGYEQGQEASGQLIDKVRSSAGDAVEDTRQNGTASVDIARAVKEVEELFEKTQEPASFASRRLIRKIRSGKAVLPEVDQPLPGEVALQGPESATGGGLVHMPQPRMEDQTEERKPHIQTPTTDQTWCPQNITLGSMILAVVLMVVLFILYFFGGAAL
ncbi:MAG TPA: proton-conducting transporter membrane subunit, partial [Bacillota bacterium]|nr:proton-conducting transporter membrane subunit [Bacillota bacterium]